MTAATTRIAAAHQCLLATGIVGLVAFALIEIVEVALDAVVIAGGNLLLQDGLAVSLLHLLDEGRVFLRRVPLVAHPLGLHREEHFASGDRRLGLLGFEISLNGVVFGGFGTSPHPRIAQSVPLF